MYEKYDLRRMIEEIREDEQINNENDKLSQDEISRMMLDRLKKKAEKAKQSGA
ncbi:hypothetical protein QUF80_11920 [Desulfococcaceae bacterium HSG8]|nr:hypothetical protein [Desulfococcaceae bacterium HSG8]